MIAETVVVAVAVGAGVSALRIKLEAGRDRARRRQEAPECGVRRLALEALCDERASDPATRAVLADACADADPLVRLTAALGLGPVDGRAILVALASEADTSDEACARAIAPIGPSLTADEARAILSASLRNRRAATAAICVDLLDRTGGADSDVLAHLLPRSDGPSLWPRRARSAVAAPPSTSRSCATPRRRRSGSVRWPTRAAARSRPSRRGRAVRHRASSRSPRTAAR